MITNDFMFDFFVENLSLPKTTKDENYANCSNYFMFDFFVSTLEPLSKNVGLNIYVSEDEPSAKNIAEKSVWVEMPPLQSNIVILDKIDSSDNYLNDLLIFTKDGVDEVNLYSGDGFTSLLKLNNIKFFNDEEILIMPYKLYVNGEWVQTENSKKIGVKIKINNQTINLSDVSDCSLAMSENLTLQTAEQTSNTLNETLNIDLSYLDNFNLAGTTINISTI